MRKYETPLNISDLELQENDAMKDLIIFGASGFGREVAWIVERINNQAPTWKLLGFMDDNKNIHGQVINGYEVLGGLNDISRYPDAYYVCAVGSSKVREKIVNRIKDLNPRLKFATIIDPSVEMSDLITVGVGTIICAHTIITVNISIGNHAIINLDCTIGHDAVLQDFVTLYPSVNISGATSIGCAVELGTGMQIIQGVKVGDHSIVGAGSVIVKDIPANCTAVGSPAKPIKFFD